MLFEVALIQQPTKKEKEEGGRETLILGPIPVIADDDKSASLKALMDNKDDEKVKAADLSRVTVLVRPFLSATR